MEVATSKNTFLKSLPREDKPLLDDQHESLCANYTNDLGLRCKKASGEGEVIAAIALKSLIGCIKFVHGRRNVMGRSNVTSRDASSLLKTAKDCASAKASKGRANPLTKEKVLEELKKIEKCRCFS